MVDEKFLHSFVWASRFEVGLLLNFGKNPYHKRKHFLNDAKEFKENLLVNDLINADYKNYKHWLADARVWNL